MYWGFSFKVAQECTEDFHSRLPNYTLAWAVSDLIAGTTVGLTIIPQVVAQHYICYISLFSGSKIIQFGDSFRRYMGIVRNKKNPFALFFNSTVEFLYSNKLPHLSNYTAVCHNMFLATCQNASVPYSQFSTWRIICDSSKKML